MMSVKIPIVMIAASLLVACGQEEQLLLPDNIEVHWDTSFNARQDGLVAVVPVDIMVYDATSGEPLSGAELELQVDSAGAFLVDVADIQPVVAKCETCDVLWDAYRDDYYDVQPELSDELSTIRLESDENGLAQFYVVVDTFATESDAFLAVKVSAETALAQGTFYLQPR